MNELIVTGAAASGNITSDLSLRIIIKSVQIDLPIDESASGIIDPSVTVSGITTGAYTFHDTVSLNTIFSPHETVYVWGNDFTAEYSAIVHYVHAGDVKNYIKSNNYHDEALGGAEASGWQSWSDTVQSGSYRSEFGMP